MALASFTIGGAAFLSGTSVAVFPAEAKKPGQAPVGLSVTTATAGSSSVAFSGLAWATRYVAYALQAGVHRYVDFKTDADPSLQPATIAYVDSQVGLDATLGGVYDITKAPYNASTAATDNTAAIQAAINAAKASGGKVYVPPGIFKYASPLNCDLPSKGFSITGASDGSGELATVPSELRYTGNASPAISCHSVFGFGLVGLRFTYNNVAFTGDLIDIDGGPHAADCTNWRIMACSSQHLGSITARSIVRMQQAINGVLRDNGFSGAVNPVRIGDPGGGYVVGVQLDNNTFNYANDAHILIGTSDGENLLITNNRFEASNNTTAIRGSTIANDGAAHQLYTPTIRDNWFGDAGSTLTWVKDLAVTSNNFFGTFSGNRMATPGAGGIHTKLTGSWVSFGNSFEGGTVYGTATAITDLIAFGNYYNDVIVYGGGRPTRVTAFGNKPAASTPQADCNDSHRARLALGEGANSNSPGFPTASFAGDQLSYHELLVLGGIDSTSPIQLGPKAGVYTVLNSGWIGHLIIQPPTDGVVTNEVKICGDGATPTPVIRVKAGACGFYNVAPVAQAARAGQLTDSTGGAVTSTLAAGITDAVAKNAIASLAAKVNALETIIHNLGLSA